MAYGPQPPAFQPPYGPPRRKMHPGLLSALIAVPIIIGLFVVVAVIGAVAGPPKETAAPARTQASSAAPSSAPAVAAPRTTAPAPKPSATAKAQPTAKEIADKLADLYPLPNPRDNTHSCAAAGCRQLITTDAVSVYQWRDEPLAKRWADGFPKDAIRRVGPYVLSFAGTEQAFTSTEARDKMAAEVKRMVG